MTARRETPSQTAGPYLHVGCTPNLAGLGGPWPADLGAAMVAGPARGERIVVEGTVRDGEGALVRDALVEIWQADAGGRFVGQAGADPCFAGWGRSAADAETGAFRFETVRPGRVPWPDGRMQAPHITVWIVARGINLGLHTRMYFPDEAEANAADPVLGLVGPARRATLIAAAAPGGYRFDIRLQGEGETVFLDV